MSEEAPKPEEAATLMSSAEATPDSASRTSACTASWSADSSVVTE